MFLTGAAIACFIASSATAQNSSEDRSAAQSEVLQRCQSCHGAGGDSEVTSTPRLNGQQEHYIVVRLKKLSDVTRNNPHAKIGMFKELSAGNDATRVSIAKYFSGQSPTMPKSGAQAVAGKLIYENGIAAENVIACKLCHGAQGEGHDLAPRIAGQHADYLRAQLRLFSIKFREHILMKPNTKTMTANTMNALTSFLAND
jgi:cytochrome c553